MDLLTVKGLCKNYGGIVALDKASFSARSGEVHALIGENGAGKSTLIQVLTGAVRHDGGSIQIDGLDYRPNNPVAAMERGVVAVFQELSLVPDFTVEQNIWFRMEPRTFLGTSNRREIRRNTLDLFKKYDFPLIQPSQDARRLTLAEQQIVEIAKALAKGPRILILDEATSALPAREAEWLLRLTRQLADEGKLVIFISHRMGEVRAIADRLTIFRNGATVAAHTANAVTDAEIVTKIIGRPLERLYPERVRAATSVVALSVQGLSCGHRLIDVSFDLHEGEVLGVGGLQGHGQGELFQALFGANRSVGKISLWGKPSHFKSPRQALTGRDGLALVPEDRRDQGLLLTKSVRKNLTISVIRRFSDRFLLNRAKEASLVKEMVDFLRIKTETPAQISGTLSGGNQQKVIIGKMLLTQARVLLLYDPTRGVDVGTKGEIFKVMRDLAAEGYAILFYSSDVQELVHVPDRVMVLRGGQVASILDGKEISEENILSAAMLDEIA